MNSLKNAPTWLQYSRYSIFQILLKVTHIGQSNLHFEGPAVVQFEKSSFKFIPYRGKLTKLYVTQMHFEAVERIFPDSISLHLE